MQLRNLYAQSCPRHDAAVLPPKSPCNSEGIRTSGHYHPAGIARDSRAKGQPFTKAWCLRRVGRPHWILRKSMLSFYPSCLSWKILKKARIRVAEASVLQSGHCHGVQVTKDRQKEHQVYDNDQQSYSKV